MFLSQNLALLAVYIVSITVESADISSSLPDLQKWRAQRGLSSKSKVNGSCESRDTHGAAHDVHQETPDVLSYSDNADFFDCSAEVICLA
jgi:hypothetical protein